MSTASNLQKGRFYSPAFEKATTIRQEKQADYKDIESYFPFDDKSYVHEIYKKSLRLVNLTKANEHPVNESIKDNLLDLINYAAYYYEHITKGK